MTAKAEVLEVVKKLPDTATYEEIAERIELLATVGEEQDQIEPGEGIPVEDVLRETSPSWITKSIKAQVLESVQNINDDATYDEVTERVRILAAIREGLDSLDRGEGVPIEEVEKMMASWITK